MDRRSRASVEKGKRPSKTALLNATRSLDLLTIQWMLEENRTLRDVRDANGANLLHVACSLLRWLLKHGASPDIRDRDGITPRARAERTRDQRYRAVFP